jgi:methionyl-tRNA synthetase
MIERYRDGIVPHAEPDPDLTGGEAGLGGVEARVSELLDDAELTQALEEIWARVRRLNRYVEESRPWDLAKDEAESGRLDQVLYNLAEGIRVLALLLYPYMPETTARLRDALGEPGRELASFGSHPGGQRVERLPPLFPKIDATS